MLEVIEREGKDMVLGSRFLGTEAVGMSRSKRSVLKAGHRVQQRNVGGETHRYPQWLAGFHQARGR
ncbi:hypothetical protein [Propioniciclava flava]